MKCRNRETKKDSAVPSNTGYKDLIKYSLSYIHISSTFQRKRIIDILDIKKTQVGNFLGVFPKNLCGIK